MFDMVRGWADGVGPAAGRREDHRVTARRRPRSSAVVTTSMSSPRPGWTLEQALALL